MKFFGLSLIALLAGSVLASPVPADNPVAASNAEQGDISNIVEAFIAGIKALSTDALGATDLKKRDDVADAATNLEKELEAYLASLLEAADLSKRQDVSTLVADIDALVSQIKEQYGVSKRDEVSDLTSTTDLLKKLLAALGA